MGTRTAQGKTAAALIVIMAAALLVSLNLAHQPADPLRDLSFSVGVLDEGLWSHNAVNDALFGRARLDDFNPMNVTAGSALYRYSYAVFGVGLRQTRMPSIFLAGLTVLVVGFLLWREHPVAGVVGAVLLATSSLYLSYSRLGLLETPAAAIAVLGLACAVLALRSRLLWPGVLAGALLAAAIAVKPQVGGAVAGAAAGLAGWAALDRKERPFRVFLAVAGGFVVLGGLWVAFAVAHLDDAARAEWQWHSSGIVPKVSDVFTNIRAYIGSSDGFGTRARPLLIAAAAGLVVQVLAWAFKRYRPGPLAFAAAGWSAAAVGVVAALPYTPSRYAVLTLPGLALTAGCGVVAVRSLTSGRTWTVAAASVLALGAGAAAIGLAAWIDWARAPEYGVRKTAAMLIRETDRGDVVYGGWGLLATVQARRRSIISHVPNINDVCPLERFGVRWVVVGQRDDVERRYVSSRYPGLLSASNLVGTSRIIGRRVELYRVPAGFKGLGCA